MGWEPPLSIQPSRGSLYFEVKGDPELNLYFRLSLGKGFRTFSSTNEFTLPETNSQKLMGLEKETAFFWGFCSAYFQGLCLAVSY